MEKDVIPEPWSLEFWQEYSEPLDWFIAEARLLAGAVQELSPKRPPAAKRPSEEPGRAAALKSLNAITRPTGRTLIEPSDGRFEMFWLAPSLLSTLGMMAAEDLVGERYLLRCVRCDRLFRSKDATAEYCVAQCRWAEQKRRSRNRSARRTVRRD